MQEEVTNKYLEFCCINLVDVNPELTYDVLEHNALSLIPLNYTVISDYLQYNSYIPRNCQSSIIMHQTDHLVHLTAGTAVE